MDNLSIIVVFAEGLLSFFSPCVLPILPIYMGNLSNSSIRKLKDGKYDIKVMLLNTLSFTIGISTTFFILGASVTLLSGVLKDYMPFVRLIGGCLIVVMGLFYMGVFTSKLLSRDSRRISKVENSNVLNSFVLGFTFSFGWTPCIGTVLTSVLLMASTSGSVLKSYVLVGVYTIGFILPFLLLSLFYVRLYNWLDGFKKRLDGIKKIGGLIIIVSGLIMAYNGYTDVVKYIENKDTNTTIGNDVFNIELKDQYGNVHKLSDYNGKTVFLNFWATWCPPCKEEMPYIEDLYNDKSDDVVVLGVTTPGLNNEGNEGYIKSFLDENGYTFTTLYDTNGLLSMFYSISAYPTTLIINTEGDVVNRVHGAMSRENMEYLIDIAK